MVSVCEHSVCMCVCMCMVSVCEHGVCVWDMCVACTFASACDQHDRKRAIQ